MCSSDLKLKISGAKSHEKDLDEHTCLGWYRGDGKHKRRQRDTSPGKCARPDLFHGFLLPKSQFFRNFARNVAKSEPLHNRQYDRWKDILHARVIERIYATNYYTTSVCGKGRMLLLK